MSYFYFFNFFLSLLCYLLIINNLIIQSFWWRFFTYTYSSRVIPVLFTSNCFAILYFLNLTFYTNDPIISSSTGFLHHCLSALMRFSSLIFVFHIFALILLHILSSPPFLSLPPSSLFNYIVHHYFLYSFLEYSQNISNPSLSHSLYNYLIIN